MTSGMPLVNGTSRECRLCHRVGSRGFAPVGCEGWECVNDRACRVRKIRRDADLASPQEGRRCDSCGDLIDPVDWCSRCQDQLRPCGTPHKRLRKRADARYCNETCRAHAAATLAAIRAWD